MSIEPLLALDVSSSTVGWAFFRDGVPEQRGKFHPEGATHDEKLHSFRLWLTSTFNTLRPTSMVIEDPYLGRNKHAYVLLYYLAVFLDFHVEVFGRPTRSGIDRIGPRVVKLLLKMPKLKDYNARKKQAVTLANSLYGLHLRYKANDRMKLISDDDVADAILLGRVRLIVEANGPKPVRVKTAKRRRGRKVT